MQEYGTKPDILARWSDKPSFPAIVALWFAFLFGGGCLILPQILFDIVFAGDPPFGNNVRFVVAVAAAGAGLMLGLAIGHKARTSSDSSKGDSDGARCLRVNEDLEPLDLEPIDLGTPHEDADDADTDAPFDDPHFASAWSDAAEEEVDPFLAGEAEEAQEEEEPEEAPWLDADPRESLGQLRNPSPRRESPPSQDTIERPSHAEPKARYNPFADFSPPDETLDQPETRATPARQDSEHDVQDTPEPASVEPTRSKPDFPPPPPILPQPRSGDPELASLGVAELVERLARAVQGQLDTPTRQDAPRKTPAQPPFSAPHHPPREAQPEPRPKPHVSRESIDRELRTALDRLSRLNDVA